MPSILTYITHYPHNYQILQTISKEHAELLVQEYGMEEAKEYLNPDGSLQGRYAYRLNDGKLWVYSGNTRYYLVAPK